MPMLLGIGIERSTVFLHFSVHGKLSHKNIIQSYCPGERSDKVKTWDNIRDES